MIGRSIALALAAIVLAPQLSNADEVRLKVAPIELESHRIAGHRRIDPSPETKKKIAADPKHPRFVIVSHWLCIDTAGNVSSLKLAHSGGYPEYVQEIETAILNTWRFKPFEQDGKPISVCTATTQMHRP